MIGSRDTESIPDELTADAADLLRRYEAEQIEVGLLTADIAELEARISRLKHSRDKATQRAQAITRELRAINCIQAAHRRESEGHR